LLLNSNPSQAAYFGPNNDQTGPGTTNRVHIHPGIEMSLKKYADCELFIKKNYITPTHVF
jgi:hypothetical protein